MNVAVFLLFCGLAFALDSGQKSYFCEDIKKPFFAQVQDRAGEYRAQRDYSIPEKFLMPKPAGVKRVFIVGESAAVILGPGAGLTAAKSVSGLEILNCGMGGYESSRLRDVLKEVLAYAPDLLVVMSGNNEGFPQGACPGPGAGLRARKSRLLERFYSLRHGPRQARKMASLKMHGAMLKDMAGAARKAGVPVVFCTLPVNLKDMLTRNPISFENRRFASGYKLFYEKAYAAAAEDFRQGLTELPENHFLNFYYAKSLEKLGRGGEARKYFLKALDNDPDMDRADTDRNALIRRVAGEEGACLADLDLFFSSLSAGGLPGFEQFVDGMHWRSSYNKAVGAELFRSAAACGIKGLQKHSSPESVPPGETPREDALKRLNHVLFWLDGNVLVGGALEELSYIRQEAPDLFKEAVASRESLAKLVIQAPLSLGKTVELQNIFPDLLIHAAETERRRADYSVALRLCDRALSLRPGEKVFRLVRAQILAGAGRRKEAENEFRALGRDGEALALGLAYGLDVR